MSSLLLCCPFAFLPLFRFCHVAFNVESCHFNSSVSADGNRLLEMSGELAGTIVRNLDLALLTGFHWLLGVLGDSTSTRCDGLIDDQHLLADVGIRKSASHLGIFLGEGAEVMGGLVELDLCRLLCQRYCQAAYGHQHCQY